MKVPPFSGGNRNGRRMPMGVFWLCFVPIFVAVDPIGVLPMYIGLVEGLEPARLKWLILKSVLTASAVSVLFLFAGAPLLAALGVTVADFMIAGGVLLFAISLSDLLHADKVQRRTEPHDPASVGAVPLGVPLIAGPALLTTVMLLANEHGAWLTALALALNMVIVGVVFYIGRWIITLLGRQGARTVSKVASLLLAAIAVMLVRKGILQILAGM